MHIVLHSRPETLNFTSWIFIFWLSPSFYGCTQSSTTQTDQKSSYPRNHQARCIECPAVYITVYSFLVFLYFFISLFTCLFKQDVLSDLQFITVFYFCTTKNDVVDDSPIIKFPCVLLITIVSQKTLMMII